MEIKIEKTECGDVEWIVDDVGGLHSEGMGWSPNKEFCGECSNIDCSTCSAWKNKN